MGIYAIRLLLASYLFSFSALAEGAELSDEALDNLVARSYQYVATYNATNRLAMAQGGWNTCHTTTRIDDEATKSLPPKTKVLYISCLIDLREDAVVLNVPRVDAAYASMTVQAYDQYVDVPLTSREGDFEEPQYILLYSARTQRYSGEPITGMDQLFETSGDFVSAIFRIVPQATDPQVRERVIEQVGTIGLTPLLAFREGRWWPRATIDFPSIGATDEEIFAHNLLEVMQFVFNHTTLDRENALDRAVLAAYRPLGVVPGQQFDYTTAPKLAECRVRSAVQRLREKWLASLRDPGTEVQLRPRLFRPKNGADLDAAVASAVIGPVGLPQEELMIAQASARY